MTVDIEGINYNIEFSGDGTALVFLHGWGGSVASFSAVAKAFSSSYRVLNLDFAGFGNTVEANRPLTVGDYSRHIALLLRSLNIVSAVFIGHSFGGRVAIKTASMYPELVKALVLVDSAGIRPRYSLKRTLNIHRYKRDKRLGKDLSRYGSSDYRALSETMKRTFVNVVNEDLSSDLKAVGCPALIIWGRRDKETPLYMARRMLRLIDDSALIVFDNAGHYSYLDEFSRFLTILDSFFLNVKKTSRAVK